MIVSKYGKSYDTANGTEQHHEGSMQPAESAGQTAQQRWEDDGGLVSRPLPAIGFAGELTSKPAWSMQSLGDLNEAIRLANDPAHRRAEDDRRIERERIRTIQADDDKVARAARAESDRYRNDWEHS